MERLGPETAEQEREFSRRRSMAGASVRHVDGGKRTMDVVVSVAGREVARQTIVYTRGKVSQRLFSLPTLEIG